jgi:hypothetical protein
MWKTGFVAIASKRGEGRGNRFASRLVTVARSCFPLFEIGSIKTTPVCSFFPLFEIGPIKTPPVWSFFPLFEIGPIRKNPVWSFFYFLKSEQ